MTHCDGNKNGNSESVGAAFPFIKLRVDWLQFTSLLCDIDLSCHLCHYDGDYKYLDSRIIYFDIVSPNPP